MNDEIQLNSEAENSRVGSRLCHLCWFEMAWLVSYASLAVMTNQRILLSEGGANLGYVFGREVIEKILLSSSGHSRQRMTN